MLNREQMMAWVLTYGSDNEGVFGMPQGWAHLQQEPNELTEWAMFLQAYHQSHSLRYFLEIGTASGGHARFLHDLLNFERMVLIDNNSHVSGATERVAILDGVKRVEIIGDSTDGWVIDEVTPDFGGYLYDLVFIDGDHEHPQPTRDAEAYRHAVRTGGLLAFHDSHHLPGVSAVTQDLIPAKWGQFEKVFDTNHRYGITAFRRI